MSGTVYVLGFAVCPVRHQVALLLKERPDWQRGKYNGIGGRVEQGESPNEAIIREGLEEVGVQLSWEHRGVFHVDAPQPATVHVYLAWLTPHERESLRTCTDELMVMGSLESLPSTCIPNLRWMLPLCLDPYVRQFGVTEGRRG